MELPKFNETFLPILEVLKDGEIIKGRDLVRLVENRFYSNLPKELLEVITKSGDRLIENRINWGKSYLKKGGLVHYPQRGYVQITEKGKSTKLENVSINDIQSNVITFYEPESKSASDQTIVVNASPQDLIDSGFEKIEREVKDELLSKLKEVDPYAFEKIILILLKKMGYGENGTYLRVI
jgi:restriction system protein